MLQLGRVAIREVDVLLRSESGLAASLVRINPCVDGHAVVIPSRPHVKVSTTVSLSLSPSLAISISPSLLPLFFFPHPLPHLRPLSLNHDLLPSLFRRGGVDMVCVPVFSMVTLVSVMISAPPPTPLPRLICATSGPQVLADLTATELTEFAQLIVATEAVQQATTEHTTPTAFNIAIKDGYPAGQPPFTALHAHVCPRYTADLKPDEVRPPSTSSTCPAVAPDVWLRAG